MMAGVRCLLWYADVEETGGEALAWRFHLPSEEAARRFLAICPLEGEGIMEAWYRCRVEEDRDRVDHHGNASVRAGQPYTQEYRCHMDDGAVRWVHEDVQVETLAPGRLWRAVGVCVDVTELKVAQEQVEALNGRLRLAMAETHHRVKNNLQVISALVDIQTMIHAESVPVSEFQRIGSHIRVLASVHDILTHEARGDAELDTISVDQTFEKLAPLLSDLAGGRPLSCSVDPMRLPLRQATSLAALVAELVSNAVKHGEGPIHVSVTTEGTDARLQVRDHGPGLPEGFNSRHHSSTGMELINSLSRWDLGGAVAFSNCPDGGACVTVTFPVP